VDAVLTKNLEQFRAIEGSGQLLLSKASWNGVGNNAEGKLLLVWEAMQNVKAQVAAGTLPAVVECTQRGMGLKRNYFLAHGRLVNSTKDMPANLTSRPDKIQRLGKKGGGGGADARLCCFTCNNPGHEARNCRARRACGAAAAAATAASKALSPSNLDHSYSYGLYWTATGTS
jgi:hypothetical protein